jgi:hypothetical protein
LRSFELVEELLRRLIHAHKQPKVAKKLGSSKNEDKPVDCATERARGGTAPAIVVVHGDRRAVSSLVPCFHSAPARLVHFYNGRKGIMIAVGQGVPLAQIRE